MAKVKLQLFFMLLLGTTLAATSQAKDVIDTALYEGLEWREIGPWRGGRVTAVTGVLSDDRTYYMGATGGGVWKTNNAGNSWRNVSDGYFGVGTIGAIAVAESDENIVYVGTGEAPIRGVTTSHGDGMYKSTDAGKNGSTSGSKTQVKLPGSLCTRPIPTSSTWPSRGKFGGPVKSVASIDQQTVGIPGNRFCRLMMRQAPQTSPWILPTLESCMRRCGSTVEPPGS